MRDVCGAKFQYSSVIHLSEKQMQVCPHPQNMRREHVLNLPAHAAALYTVAAPEFFGCWDTRIWTRYLQKIKK